MAALHSAVYCPNTSGYGCLSTITSWKRKKVQWFHTTLSFGVSLWYLILSWGVWLTNSYSYVYSQYCSNGVLLHQKNTESRKSHHFQFSAAFLHRVSFYIHSRLVCCAVKTSIYEHMKVKICAQCHGLRNVQLPYCCVNWLARATQESLPDVPIFDGCPSISWRFLIYNTPVSQDIYSSP